LNELIFVIKVANGYFYISSTCSAGFSEKRLIEWCFSRAKEHFEVKKVREKLHLMAFSLIIYGGI
jgi:hypothetical protein